MILPLAASTITFSIDLEWAVLLITAALGSIGGGLKIVWSYWTNREQKRIDRYKEILDAKDATITAKDAQITELGKELSRKSDAHAAKIEELMGVTLTKVEAMGQKNEGLLDRALKVMTEFTEQVRRIGDGTGASQGGPHDSSQG